MIRKILIGIAIALGALTLLSIVTVGVLYVANRGEHIVPATTADDPSLPFIELDGYRFHAKTFGSPDNQTVVVLHGGPGGDYRSILPLAALADEYYVVFYDQRGAGLSPRTAAADLTVERYVQDLDLFVEHYSPDRPVYLVGHSWGAMLASSYLEEHGSRVSKVVLAEPGFLDHEHMERWNEKTGLLGGSPGGASVLAAMASAWAKSLHVDGPDDQAAGDHMMGQFMETDMESHPLAGYYVDNRISNAAGEAWRFGALASRAVQESGFDDKGRLMDLAAGAATWNGEALFIAGSENSIIGPEQQRSQMKRFAGARLVVIEGAGHTMIGEKPDETVGVVRAFLGTP